MGWGIAGGAFVQEEGKCSQPIRVRDIFVQGCDIKSEEILWCVLGTSFCRVDEAECMFAIFY